MGYYVIKANRNPESRDPSKYGKLVTCPHNRISCCQILIEYVDAVGIFFLGIRKTAREYQWI